jgi:hypothetical protein
MCNSQTLVNLKIFDLNTVSGTNNAKRILLGLFSTVVSFNLIVLTKETPLCGHNYAFGIFLLLHFLSLRNFILQKFPFFLDRKQMNEMHDHFKGWNKMFDIDR